MTCPFRYVDATCDASVNLHLFRTMNGTPRGNVKGPLSQHVDGHSTVFELEIFIPLQQAFASAIRMANCHDTDVVVSGDRTLWDARWGELGAVATPRVPCDGIEQQR